MKNMFWKKAAAALLLCSLFPLQAEATQQKIDQVQEGIEDLEDQEEEAQQKAEYYTQEAGGLEGDLAEFNNRLLAVVQELNDTEQQLEATKKDLEVTKTKLKKAEKREQKQYEAMKKRIRFIYEMDQEGILEILLGAEDFADFLNKTEYFANIHQYDRDMLDEYRRTKVEIADRKQELGQQAEALVNLQKQQNGKKQELDALVADTSEHLKAARRQLANAQADVVKYQAEIKRQKAYEAELEAKKAAEDAKRLEEIRRQEEENRNSNLGNGNSNSVSKSSQNKNQGNSGQNSGGNNNSDTNTDKGNGNDDSSHDNDSGGQDSQGNASDLSLMAALIQCEAGGESYEGKLAVGSVVMNRVSSSHFPNSVAGVIYQSGQFTPVASGRFASVLAAGANQSCVQAAQEVLGGNITNNCLYFRRNNGEIPGTVIGNHVFY